MRYILVLACICTLSVFAFAQKAEIFGGYTFSHVSNGFGSANTNGWNASGTGYVIKYFGFTANIGADYSHGNDLARACVTSTGGCALPEGNPTLYTATFGPQVRVPLRNVSIFAHGLFGVAHLSGGGALSNNSFATGLGGGVEYKFAKIVSLRIGQLDYLHTSPHGVGLNHVRYSTGIVLRF